MNGKTITQTVHCKCVELTWNEGRESLIMEQRSLVGLKLKMLPLMFAALMV